MSSSIHELLNLFSDLGISPVDLIITLLKDKAYKDHDTMRGVVERVPKLIDVLLKQINTRGAAMNHILQVSTERYTTELTVLTRDDAGFHFTAAKITEMRLEAVQLTEMATRMKSLAPSLWILLDNLLSADHAVEYQ